MGVVEGRTYREIAAYAGAAHSTQELTDGTFYCDWQHKDFWSNIHVIVLGFDRYGVCRGVFEQGRQTSGGGIGIGIGF